MEIQSLLKTIKAKISEHQSTDRSHLSISLIRFVWKSVHKNLLEILRKAKRPTRADTSAYETGILSLMELWTV